MQDRGYLRVLFKCCIDVIRCYSNAPYMLANSKSNSKQQTPYIKQQTADSRQQTADSRQQTAGSRQQAADTGGEQEGGSRQQTADSSQQR
jgi:hypothetical protein